MAPNIENSLAMEFYRCACAPPETLPGIRQRIGFVSHSGRSHLGAAAGSLVGRGTLRSDPECRSAKAAEEQEADEVDGGMAVLRAWSAKHCPEYIIEIARFSSPLSETAKTRVVVATKLSRE